MGVPLLLTLFSLAAFKILSLTFVVYNSDISLCGSGLGPSVLLVHGYLFLFRFMKFSAIISSNTFSIPFLFSF